MNGFLVTFGAYERFVHKLHFCTCPELQFWLPSIIDVQQIVHKLQSCTASRRAHPPAVHSVRMRGASSCVAPRRAEPPAVHSVRSRATSDRAQPSAFRSAFGGKSARRHSSPGRHERDEREVDGGKQKGCHEGSAARSERGGREELACLQLVEHWLHVLEGAELGESDILQALAHHGDVRAEVLGLVRVAADREDTSAQVAVQAQ